MLSTLFPATRPLYRLVRCIAGLVLFGSGISLMLASELGGSPWDVFHTGVSDLFDIGVGTVIVITGVVLLLVWIPLRERPGVGTILNAVLVGVFVDLTQPLMPDSQLLLVRWPLLGGGILAIAIGSGFYIGSGLGPGPRDGIMTGLAKRSIAGRPISVRAARTAIEIAVTAAGVMLGGAIGLGTAAFALSIGPLVQVFLPRLTVG